MSIEHFTMFAFGFLSAWICCQIQAEALRRIIRRKPRNDRSGPQFNEGRTIRGNGNGGPTTPKPSFAEPLTPLPRNQDPDWRRSFNHDNTNKKPTSNSPPRLFRRRPPEVTQ